jgi:hypothetical protein
MACGAGELEQEIRRTGDEKALFQPGQLVAPLLECATFEQVEREFECLPAS